MLAAVASSLGAARGRMGVAAASSLSRLRYSTQSTEKVDVAVVGAGHNGLIAATLMARSGLKVKLLDRRPMVGGACATEYPFKGAAEGLPQSTGAYLLGVMPPELMAVLGIDIPTVRRDPHYFLPTTDHRYLLFGSDEAETRNQFLDFFSAEDWEAHCALQSEIAKLREDVAATWLMEPLSIEATASKYVRPQLQDTFVDLCRKPVGEYLERFGFRSDLLKAMYAVTDGFSGLNGDWDTPGTGMNFLMHNMCRLPGSDGTWCVVQGGMGTVTKALAVAAMKAGVDILTDAEVASIEVNASNAVEGVVLTSGARIVTNTVVSGADPFAMRELVGREKFSPELNTDLDNMKRDGTTMKVNLALKDLPTFTCLPERRGQHNTTIHLLPDESEVMQCMSTAFDDVKAGRLPEFPTIEWYTHTPVDPTMTDANNHISAALFVQWVPYELADGSWEDKEDEYVQHLLSICDRFAPGTSDLVADTFTLTPPKIESHFGITRGHIHHVDNAFGFDERFPYRTSVQGLYSASAGTHPAGSVIGCAGHNAAGVVVKDMGLTPTWPTAQP